MRTTAKDPSRMGIGKPPKFQIDCFPFIFSLEELEVLETKGYIMKALADGKRSPANTEERSFVHFLNGDARTGSAMESAWHKYRNRRKLEASMLMTEEVYQEYLKFRQ